MRACVRVCVRACARACVRACMRACVRACVRVCVCVCVYVHGDGVRQRDSESSVPASVSSEGSGSSTVRFQFIIDTA